MKEAHIYDLSSNLDVRLSEQMITRIRSMCVDREIRVEDQKEHIAGGWRFPHKRRFLMKKRVRLIANSNGHPYQKIGGKLFSKYDWHGKQRGPKHMHKPYITQEELKLLQQVTEISMDELERSIVAVRNGPYGKQVWINFPVSVSEGWAWLFGLWYSAGGAITRQRIGYEEHTLRFILEKRVFEEKVKEAMETCFGYEPKLTENWYVHKGVNHVLDKGRRSVGGVPRKILLLPRPIREIMEHFELPITPMHWTKSGGGKPANRRLNMHIPTWISGSETYKHAFVEGYLNGCQVSSVFNFHNKGRKQVRTCNVELRFGTPRVETTKYLHDFFADYLETLGIYGFKYHILHADRKWSRLGLMINNKKSIRGLYEQFDIRRSDLRARLILTYFMDALLFETCRRITSHEALILGGLLEKSMTEAQLSDNFRMSPEMVEKNLKRLRELEIVKLVGSAEAVDYFRWTVIPTTYRDKLVKELQKMEEARRSTLNSSAGEFFSRCSKCRNVIRRNYEGPCECGGNYVPITRSMFFKTLRNSDKKIQTIKGQELKIPT